MHVVKLRGNRQTRPRIHLYALYHARGAPLQWEKDDRKGREKQAREKRIKGKERRKGKRIM